MKSAGEGGPECRGPDGAPGKAPEKASDADYVYTFAGWTPEIVPVTGEATYTATYTATPKTEYTVIWLNGDGTKLDRKTYKEGQAEPTTDRTPVKAEDEEYIYTFSKWDSGKKDGNVTTYTPEFKAEKKPEPKIWTVSFETNGGTAVAAQTVTDGETAAKPADPTKEGYTFAGWYSDEALSTAYDFTKPVTADLTLYAKWTENPAPVEITYTVVSGGDSSWTKGSEDAVEIVVKRSPDDSVCFSHFTEVKVDGEALSGDAYSAKAGSTVVTLPASTLETWKTGKHTVTVVFDDGEAETTLTVRGRGLLAPKTGDGGLTPFWVLLMALGAGGIAFTALGGRRYRRPKYVGKH